MDAPLHKLCGTRHWSKEPCPLDAKSKAERVNLAERRTAGEGGARPGGKLPRATEPKSKKRASSSVVEQTSNRAEDAGSIPASPPAKKRGRPATGFDKKSYQRELMRKRRAEKAPTKTEEPK